MFGSCAQIQSLCQARHSSEILSNTQNTKNKGLGFVSLATLDLYKEASEKRGVDQGCLRCTTEVTNQG